MTTTLERPARSTVAPLPTDPGGRRSPRRVVVAVAAVAAVASVAGVATSRPGRPAPSRPALAVARALGIDVDGVRLGATSVVHAASGSPRLSVQVDGVGLVQLDPATYEVNEIIFDANVAHGSGELVGRAGAIATARGFAQQHYVGFASLAPRGVELIDHAEFAEYRVEWQARNGARVWLPSRVVVGVNARTGAVAYYWSERVAATIATDALVDERAAIAAAHALVTREMVWSRPELSVLAVDGHQRLVWSVAAHALPDPRAHVPVAIQVWVDAMTGVAEVAATT